MASTDGMAPLAPLAHHQAPWPAHPKPHVDETMTSWLLRVAEANGIPFQALCAEGWQGKKVQQTCLDRCPSDRIVEALMRCTGRTAKEIRSTTLGALGGRLFQGPLQGRTQWVLPSSEGKRSAGHQQFCPECLAEDGKPHYRLGWQLAFATGCPRHGNRPLLDACPFCHSPLDLAHNHAPKKRNQPDHRITVCRHCGMDLREAIGIGTDGVRLLTVSLDRKGHALQAQMAAGLREGWMRVGGQEGVFACLAFDGIHQIVKSLTAKRSAPRLWTVIGKRLGMDGHGIYMKLGIEGHPFESLDVTRRRHLMSLAAWLLDEWPHRFVSVCREAKVWSNHIKQDRLDRTPFWLANVVESDLKIQHATWRDPAQKGQKRAVDSYTRLGRRVMSPRLADRARKIHFIREHSELVMDLRALALAMRSAGLYSMGSEPNSIMALLPKMIAAAQAPEDPLLVHGIPLAMQVRNKDYPFPRGRAYLSPEEEGAFMASFWEGERLGIPITARAVKEAMSEFLRRPITESAIYKFLRRKGWVAPNSPKRKAANPIAQEVGPS
ncbi:MAG: TniQ family protein [Holophaga sp.]|nr:TniQ family protein [Holophaga sp.]